MTALFPRTTQGLIAFYNYVLQGRGVQFPKHLVAVAHALIDKRIHNLLIICGPGSGKALHPDTRVLTPEGWRKIEDLKVGDAVMHPSGSVSRVRFTVRNSPDILYKMTFADGRSIRANRDHLWSVYNKKFLHFGETLKWRLRTTEELAQYIPRPKARMWYIPLSSAIGGQQQDLPIEPYILGLALGDGRITANGYVVLTTADEEIVQNVRNLGFDIRKINSRYGYGIRKIGKLMCALGLRDSHSWDKFVPEIYLNASVDQRRSLLQGLMDTDGTVSHDLGTVSYCTTSIKLAEHVTYLVRSLGGMAYTAGKIPYAVKDGVRTQGKKAYIISIRHPEASSLFRLTRKKILARPTQYSDDLKLQILRVEPELELNESVCIGVDNPDGLFVAEDYIVTHNSVLLSQIYPLFEIGHDPTTTVLGLSAGEALMQGFLGAVQQYICSSDWAAAFPGIGPDYDRGWSSERGIFVTGHGAGDPDSTYFVAGITSKAFTGKHARIVLGDDLHDRENSMSAEACLRVRETYYRQVPGRGDPRGARFIFAGRRWHEDDLYGHLKDPDGSGRTDYVVMELPAVRKSEDLYWAVTLPDKMVCCFNDGTVPSVKVED